MWRDLLLWIYRSNIEATSWQSGHFVARAAIPSGAIHQGGRFFFGQGVFYAVNYDGQRLWLEKLPTPNAGTIRFFDRKGIDGPLALLRDGRIIAPGQKWVWDTPGPQIKRVLGITPNGHRIAISSWHGSQPASYLIDLCTSAGWKMLTGDPHEALMAPDFYRSNRRGPTLRHNFQGIYNRGNGELALLSKKDRVLSFGLSATGEMMLIDRGRPAAGDQKPIRFSPAAGPVGTRYELGVAGWRDGSRAYLDSRGLLHLKSSDSTLPEISLVLSNGPLAGWSSDFERFGPEFFFESVPTSDATHFLSLIRAFLARAR